MTAVRKSEDLPAEVRAGLDLTWWSSAMKLRVQKLMGAERWMEADGMRTMGTGMTAPYTQMGAHSYVVLSG